MEKNKQQEKKQKEKVEEKSITKDVKIIRLSSDYLDQTFQIA